MSHTPTWARASGTDDYGRWACFELDGVEQRLRWIEAGSFVMGSPVDEPGRLEREGPAHTVVLSEGFWMAQTPCTQALWEVVMGTNPSRYVSPERPVDHVSWHEVQIFVDQLTSRVEGLRPALPSEAQWEYACRAGCDAATYAGPLDVRGECDAPVLDAIAWYCGNSGVDFDLPTGYDSSEWPQMQHPHTRAATRVVARKQPNAWGLYDMLGNVWEWCADPRRRYAAEPTRDPLGTKGTKRCSRGGCWHASARYCRAAFRYSHHPDNRSHYLGFRMIASD